MNAIPSGFLTSRSRVAKALVSPVMSIRRKVLEWNSRYKTEIIRNICELLHEDPKLALREFQGVFALDPRSYLFARYVLQGCYEPKLVDVVRRYIKTERDAIDIGANVGFYTILLAKLLPGRRVLAVEPTAGALRRLTLNIDLNNVRNQVIVFEGVVSNVCGTAQINVITGNEEYSSLGKIHHPSIVKQAVSSHEVASKTLDKVVEECSICPGFIKIDVEGVEHLVFEGAKNVLSKYRPIILSELSDELLRENGTSARSVIAAIEKHNYVVIDPINPSVRVGSKRFGDILCIPREVSLTDT